MCGLVGLLNLSGAPLEDESVVRSMNSILVHRGPDDEGYLADGPLAFGFRRLSIIDLGTGHQPLSNENETVWVMLNGEIYNFVELHQELEGRGHRFRTKSDTEVIVHAYEEYGTDFVRHLRGMFAIALWDGKKKILLLVRDRIGEKPLFYGVQDGQLAFASEVKALMKWPKNPRMINHQALHDYLTFLYVPGPKSIIENVFKLPPAHMLVAQCGNQNISLERYWSVSPRPDRSKSFSYYVEGLKSELSEAVRIRLRSDVPLGAFLSGGIDSTIVVGLMSQEIPQVKTFSIGFPDPKYDESSFARLVALSVGSAHTEEFINPESMTPDDLIDLVWYMDEPFGDSSFIPTYWVSKAARKQVTVALSGDGGDELFAGYPRYRYYQWLSRLNSFPRTPRMIGHRISRDLSTILRPLFPGAGEYMRQAQKAFNLSMLDDDSRRLALSTFFDEESKKQLYSEEGRERVSGYTTRVEIGHAANLDGRYNDFLSRVMARDVETNLVDDSLVKVDRASMACSLEVRAPFLDHHVVEFAMQIPSEFKLRRGLHKVVLKEAFAALLPQEIKHRRKQGFEVPFARWFQRHAWRSLLTDTLSEERIRRQGIFNSREVVKLRDLLLDDPEASRLGISAYQLRHRVWALLMFQIWHQRFLK